MKHIVHIIANNNTVPYFRWFAEQAYNTNEKRVSFSFVMLSPKEPPFAEEIKHINNNVYWIKFDASKRKSSMISAYFKLKKLLKKLNPDVLNTHLFDDSVPALLAAKQLGIKKRVITKNDTAFHFKYAQKGMKWDNFNNKNATDVVAISNEAKQFIIDHEKNWNGKLTMIHHGIQSSMYENANADKQYVTDFIEKHKLQDTFVFGTVSRFIDWKGYKSIIEVAKIVVPKDPSIRFMFFGSGDQKEEIISLIKLHQLEENIIIPGYIEPKYMPSIYACMNGYLHAAKLEPFGFVIAEAMIAGLPVLSTPTGAALDGITHGENGWITPYDDVQQMAEYILKIKLENRSIPWDAPHTKGVSLFDFSIMYENYIKLYLA